VSAEEGGADERAFPIVGVGASAGGVEALERFLRGLAPSVGAAVVVVVHLDPNRSSMMAKVLGRAARMPVREAEDGALVEPGRVYVIPPNAGVSMEGQRLRVRSLGGQHHASIDAFFCSLAQQQGKAAVGVVLSGAGSDGTAGLRAIKGHGGLTLAQDPDEAASDGMPRSAIALGAVDWVLPAGEMAAKIAEHADRLAEARVATSAGSRAVPAVLDETRWRVRVPRFFRELEVFARLGAEVIPALLHARDPKHELRVWVPCCATGEEAYSIAIMIREALASLHEPPQVKVFATDVDGQAIDFARRAQYPSGIAAHVSPERLACFFHVRLGRYQVSPEVRKLCIFSEHDILADPPFNRLDLIWCNDLRFDHEVQERLGSLFHYALVPAGYLVLGPSPSLATHPELFRALDERGRIFQRLNTPAARTAVFPIVARVAPAPRPPVGRPPRPSR
jgi:two-component system CheB/CheR fusion protein